VASPAAIAFYFDFISPYAFLAWTQIRELAARHGREVEPVAVVFAALLDAHGTKGPAEVAAKRAYLGKDLARKAHRLGIAGLRPPPSHPFHPIAALRAASVATDPKVRERIVDALFLAVWTKGEAIDRPERVKAVLDAAGLDGTEIVRATAEIAVKDRLRTSTDAAIAKGIFGVPTAEADGELFWGTDSLPELELFLQGNLPSSALAFADAWTSLPAGATRKGSP
jgi:2-hydroxychromene-2-carboxylate isomerase